MAEQPSPVYSSGVAFFPPFPARKGGALQGNDAKRKNKENETTEKEEGLWRIGGKFYDLSLFLSRHPGGPQVLRLARDRFDDATFVFESHHHNYHHARKILAKYEVKQDDYLALKAARSGVSLARLTPDVPDRDSPPSGLLGDDAFYSVLRRRVTSHLKKVGAPDGGPTLFCLGLFWAVWLFYCVCLGATYWTGSPLWAIGQAYFMALVGAFGHNWVHQPRYRWMAYLSLDMVGFSSDGWEREHNLQHHMYTNTALDNHFRGTDPFLVTDPTCKRHWIQAKLMPYINPVILSFGLFGNYIAHTGQLLRGQEVLTPWKLFFPLHIAAMVHRHGLVHGLGLVYLWCGLCGIWYFTMALLNHNTEHTHDVKKRNTALARDWGAAQLSSSSDWGTAGGFLASSRSLWLNYHSVHHVFPRVDFCHHPAIQQILIETCKEFEIEYEHGDWFTLYREMISSFASPRSLFASIQVYGGVI